MYDQQTLKTHFSEKVSIRTRDGHTLAGTWFPRSAGPARGAVIIQPAVAVPQRYYTDYAGFLADRGFDVLTFDYRGVGRSAPRRLRGYEATMRQWGERDLDAALRWADRSLSEGPRLAVCHSFGGQALGLSEAATDVLSGALLVASGSGWVGHWSGRARRRYERIWRRFVPALTSRAAFGYLPGWAGAGEDLPRGVAREWARWCLSEDHLLEHVPRARERFGWFPHPVRAIQLTDDDYAPAAAVDALLGWFGSAPVDKEIVSPQQLGVERIGHFGFFRERFRSTLWRRSAAWLEARGERQGQATAALVKATAAPKRRSGLDAGLVRVDAGTAGGRGADALVGDAVAAADLEG